MTFQWAAVIALWTFLIGPVLAQPGPVVSSKPPSPALSRPDHNCASGSSGPASPSRS
jgi:hypothetical protein